MAILNLSRKGDNQAQRPVVASMFSVDMALTPVVTGDTLVLGTLPAGCVIQSVVVVPSVPSDATTATAMLRLAGVATTAANVTMPSVQAIAVPATAQARSTVTVVSLGMTITGVQTVGAFDVIVTYADVARRLGTYTNEVK